MWGIKSALKQSILEILCTQLEEGHEIMQMLLSILGKGGVEIVCLFLEAHICNLPKRRQGAEAGIWL